MTQREHPQRPREILRPSWVVMLLCLAAAGCANSTLAPNELPSDLLAPPVENVQTLDLSRLSGYAVSNELIEAGDVLEVTIVSGYTERGPMTVPVRVAENGMANIPLIGEVALAGFELDAAEQAIRAEAIARGLFRNPHVTVIMDTKRICRVTVIGAVNEPGVKELPRSSSDLLAAIVAAGGLADDAGTDVEVRSPAKRAGPGNQPGSGGDMVAAGAAGQPVNYQQAVQPPRSVRINLVAASQSGQGGVALGDGDVVMVMKRDPKPVHVMGLVRKPGQYELPPNQDLRVLDAIAMAGGASSSVANKVFVIRRRPGDADSAVIQISMHDAKRDGTENLRLAAGDTVSVEQTPHTVALDAVKSFVRIGLTSAVPFF